MSTSPSPCLDFFWFEPVQVLYMLPHLIHICLHPSTSYTHLSASIHILYTSVCTHPHLIHICLHPSTFILLFAEDTLSLEIYSTSGLKLKKNNNLSLALSHRSLSLDGSGLMNISQF